MTSIAIPAAAPADGSKTSRWRFPLWPMIAAALALGCVLSFAGIHKVWRDGTFFDSDDAMQLVQVRDLLAGQNWFDMTVARLDPPRGVFMHWSRTVDVPLALMIKTFGLLLPVQTAERLTRLVFPLILQALLYGGVARLARILIGPRAVSAAIALLLLSGMEFGEFQPGRIDHTAPQIVLLLFMLGSLVEAIDPAYARRAAIVGVLAAVSLSISIENLPFILAFAALYMALWIARGTLMQKALASFGVGLGAALPLAFVATIGRAHWFEMACDAYSAAYLVPGLAVAAALVALGAWVPETRPVRFATAGVAAGIVLAVVIFTKPICFLDPYTGVDPLVRQIWLNNVEEAMPFSRFFYNEPDAAAIYALPIAFGFVAILVAACREQGLSRLRWMVVVAVSALAVALSCWMIRVIGFASPIALLGAAWCVIRCQDFLEKTRWRAVALLAFALILPFSSIGWALVLTQDPQAAARAERAACLASAAFVPLAELPPGIVLAPIDAGSHLLALTPHSVLAAPYHRDNAGNRAALDAFLAEPQAARQILRANHVAYVMTCRGLNETAALATRAPHGLAAALLRGAIPDWLKALPRDGAYQVFVMRP